MLWTCGAWQLENGMVPWWFESKSDVARAMQFAYYGPHFDGDHSSFPYEFEAEEREDPSAHPHVVELVSGRQLLGHVAPTKNRIAEGEGLGTHGSAGAGEGMSRPTPWDPLELTWLGKRIAYATSTIGEAQSEDEHTIHVYAVSPGVPPPRPSSLRGPVETCCAAFWFGWHFGCVV